MRIYAMRAVPAHAIDRRDAGLTLIEVLVVLALIAVLAGSASIGLGRIGREDRLAEAAALLATRLQTVADAAVHSGTPAAFLWTRDGYGFATLTGGEWAPAPTGFAPETRLDGGLSLYGDGSAFVIHGHAVPDGDPLVLRLESGSAAVQVRFDGLTAQVAALDGAP